MNNFQKSQFFLDFIAVLICFFKHWVTCSRAKYLHSNNKLFGKLANQLNLEEISVFERILIFYLFFIF